MEERGQVEWQERASVASIGSTSGLITRLEEQMRGHLGVDGAFGPWSRQCGSSEPVSCGGILGETKLRGGESGPY